MVAMGYYDGDHTQNRVPKRNGKKGGYLLASLVGVIIGALLVAIIFPNLGIGGNEDAEEKVEETNEALENRKTENVSLDVTTDVTKAVEKVTDSVVGITNIQSASFWSNTEEAGTGSGVIYKKADGKAYIVTNHHVIEKADQLEVTLADGSKEPAQLRGSDMWTDLAVIEIKADHVDTVAEFGDSSTLKTGEPVIAIGNPLGLQFSGSVTQGIVSAIDRTVPIDLNKDGLVDWQAEVIQTDAAINPGNSGGALINIAGQLIGINSMKIATQAVEGIGFSIPINYARPIINDLEKYGEIKRPAIGVTLRDVAEVPAYHQQETLKLPKEITEGVMVERVLPGSPAEKAGMEEFDVIIALDGKEVEDVLDLRKHLYEEKKIGDKLKVTFYRNGKKEETTITLTGEGKI